ncbi:MAG TPA: glycoside hydrolase family 130 protein [Tepidisphaeraceae bacterium]|jgi:predicted GH43/DUF377 family glycosyl hydrolase
MNTDLAQRFENNPLISAKDVKPSRPDFEVAVVLNPGAFRFNNQTCLMLRVAERPAQEKGWISTPILGKDNQIEVARFRLDDPNLDYTDPRVFKYKGLDYLTTLSHLRIARSDDGRHFIPDDKPTLQAQGRNEGYGIEDCRVHFFNGQYYLTFSECGPDGIGSGLASTKEFKTFVRYGMIASPHNKDVTLFTEQIDGSWWSLHRPSGSGYGGHFIWTGRSPDLVHWGRHQCLIRSRPGFWDSQRVGCNAEPIKTDGGWLILYHGADDTSRYCQGALLVDLKNPNKILARSDQPIMAPTAPYEKEGFFGNVVFTNGHVVDGDTLWLYYGAADTCVCGATLSIKAILEALTPVKA